jgi:multisubunit Na+/H+ antiporter MnhC subunit
MTAPSLELVLFIGALGLIGIGAAGLALSRDLFRVILALAIAEAGANLLLVLAGYRWDAVAPILTGGQTAATNMVDPVPQAMVLTAIVIGVGIQALAVALAIRVYRAYGTLDVRELRTRLELDICDAAGVEAPGSSDAPAGERPLPSPVAARGSGS